MALIQALHDFRAPIDLDNGESRAAVYLGRTVHVVECAAEDLAGAVYAVVREVVNILNEMRNDCNAVAGFFRGVGYTLLALKERGVIVLSALDLRAASVVNLIDALQIFADLDYFLNRRWLDERGVRKVSYFDVVAHVALAIADVGGAVLWLEELGFALSKAVNAIGNVRVFRFVPLIPLGTIVTGVVGVGFAFLGADALWRLGKTFVTDEVDPNANPKRIKALLDLGWCAAEVVGKIIVVAGALSLIPAAPPVVIAALGITAAGFGLASFAYGVYNKKRLKTVAPNDDMMR